MAGSATRGPFRTLIPLIAQDIPQRRGEERRGEERRGEERRGEERRGEERRGEERRGEERRHRRLARAGGWRMLGFQVDLQVDVEEHVPRLAELLAQALISRKPCDVRKRLSGFSEGIYARTAAALLDGVRRAY